MKFLTLNLFKGKCLDAVCDFINKEQFDLVQMQEVAGSSVSFPGIDCFTEIKKRTGLEGELLVSWHLKDDNKAYFGNATFFNKSLKLKKRRDLHLQPFQELESLTNPLPAAHPRSALFLELEHEGHPFWSINTHLAWGPTPFDEPYKIETAKSLADALASLKEPFILSGDFNVVTTTEVIKLFEPFGRNLTREYNLTNTLNANLHRVKHLFPPGLAVDYIFTHPLFRVDRFEVIEEDLSDHKGLVAELYF